MNESKFSRGKSCFSLDLCVLVTQSCPVFCGPMDCSPPGSSVHGMLQGRILEWAAIPFSRGSSQPRHQIHLSCIAGRFLTIWAIREASNYPNSLLESPVHNSSSPLIFFLVIYSYIYLFTHFTDYKSASIFEYFMIIQEFFEVFIYMDVQDHIFCPQGAWNIVNKVNK